MKPELLTAAKEVALQIWDLETRFARLIPTYKDQGLVKRLTRIEAKPAEDRTDGDLDEMQEILGQLSENPPWKRVAYPSKDGLQPLPKPSAMVLKRMAEAQAYENLSGLDKITQFMPDGTQFVITDGYAPMMLRQALSKRAEERAQMTFWGRVGNSITTFFRRKTK